MSVKLGRVPPKGYVTWTNWFNGLPRNAEFSFGGADTHWIKRGDNDFCFVHPDGTWWTGSAVTSAMVTYAKEFGITFHPPTGWETEVDPMAGISYTQAQTLLAWVNKKVEEAYVKGYEEGRVYGFDAGYLQGRDKGYTDGWDGGYEAGRH